MGRRKKTEINPVCEKCGKTPEINKELSNENWSVFDTACTDCGGKVIFAIYKNGERVKE